MDSAYPETGTGTGRLNSTLYHVSRTLHSKAGGVGELHVLDVHFHLFSATPYPVGRVLLIFSLVD